jgi:hypothetical protein
MTTETTVRLPAVRGDSTALLVQTVSTVLQARYDAAKVAVTIMR